MGTASRLGGVENRAPIAVASVTLVVVDPLPVVPVVDCVVSAGDTEVLEGRDVTGSVVGGELGVSTVVVVAAEVIPPEVVELVEVVEEPFPIFAIFCISVLETGVSDVDVTCFVVSDVLTTVGAVEVIVGILLLVVLAALLSIVSVERVALVDTELLCTADVELDIKNKTSIGYSNLSSNCYCYVNKNHLKNVGPIRHCEPPHAHSPGVATARCHCRTPPAHRCPRQRRQQQRLRVTEGTATAP